MDKNRTCGFFQKINERDRKDMNKRVFLKTLRLCTKRKVHAYLFFQKEIKNDKDKRKRPMHTKFRRPKVHFKVLVQALVRVPTKCMTTHRESSPRRQR